MFISILFKQIDKVKLKVNNIKIQESSELKAFGSKIPLGFVDFLYKQIITLLIYRITSLLITNLLTFISSIAAWSQLLNVATLYAIMATDETLNRVFIRLFLKYISSIFNNLLQNQPQ